MEPIFTLFLFCGWHLLVLGLGAAIGLLRPWQWRIVRPGTPGQRQPDTYYDDEPEVFNRVVRS